MTFHKLRVAPRHVANAMRRAIQDDPFRALIELILNADDSYRRLEDQGVEPSGIIEIEFERQRDSAHFAVRDFAEGMGPGEALNKILGWGEALSGHAEGSARGFFGRGGKDALFEMAKGELITCKDNVITKLVFTEEHGERGVNEEESAARASRRQAIGIPGGNGTLASFDLPASARVPRFETVRETLSTLYPLRKVLSNPNRDIRLKYRGESVQLQYMPPVGQIAAEGKVDVSTDAGNMMLEYCISVAPNELDQAESDRREGGLLVMDEKDAVIDLSLYHFNREPDAERIFGEVRVHGLRDAMRGDENIVTEERNGLNNNNKSAKKLIAAIEALVDPIVRKLRDEKRHTETDQSDKTRQKVTQLTTALNELAAKITGGKGDKAPGSDAGEGTGRVTRHEAPEIKPDPILSIPASLTLTPRTGSQVSIYFDTSRCKGDVIIDAQGSDDIEFSPDQFVIDSTQAVFRHDIEVFGLSAGAEGTLVILNDGGELSIPFKVVAEVYPTPDRGFAFVPESVSATTGRSRTLQLYIDTEKVGKSGDIILTVGDDAVAHVDRTFVQYSSDEALYGIVRVGVKITGVKVGGSTNVTAVCGDYEAKCTFDVVSRRAPKPSVGGFFNGLDWDRNKFPKCHFRLDDSKIVVHCQEPTFQLLGVSPFAFDHDRAVQVAVAEACTQVACQRIAEATVPGQGRRRAYLHPNDDKKRLEEDYAFIQDLTKEVGPVVYRALVEDLPKVATFPEKITVPSNTSGLTTT
jgi:hypothetical protein